VVAAEVRIVESRALLWCSFDLDIEGAASILPHETGQVRLLDQYSAQTPAHVLIPHDGIFVVLERPEQCGRWVDSSTEVFNCGTSYPARLCGDRWLYPRRA